MIESETFLDFKKNQSFTAYYIFDLGISLNFAQHKFSHLWNRRDDDFRGIKWDNGWEYFSQNLKMYKRDINTCAI